MTNFLRSFISIICVSTWISISEYIRNEILYRQEWIDQYEKTGLLFPEREYMWILWALLYACFILALTLKFSRWKSIIITWLTGILLMWLTIGYNGTIPLNIFIGILPLSFIESAVSVYLFGLIRKNPVKHL
ncbi:MAG: hypothetical protein ACRCX5_12095 [Bacteroidales bacterium]